MPAMSKKPKVRFAFTVGEGPNQGCTSGPLRVWTHKEDTYIAGDETAKIWKASLHGDDAWRFAMTSEHHASGEEPRLPDVPEMPQRAPWTFEPTPFIDGVRLAFVVAAFRSALLPKPQEKPGKDIVQVLVRDRYNELTKVEIWMTEPDTDIHFTADSPEQQIAAPLPLASGRRVWLFAARENIPEPDDDDSTPYVGSLIQPQVPGIDAVSAPGVLLIGVRIG